MDIAALRAKKGLRDWRGTGLPTAGPRMSTVTCKEGHSALTVFLQQIYC